MKPGIRLFSAGLGLIFAASIGGAQTTGVFASGLQFPSKVIAIGGGNLLVTEAGLSPNAGRVSLVNSGGAVRTLVDGLPSGPAAPNYEQDGPDGILLSGRTLYVAIGEGDGFVNGPTVGTIVPNPKGPSSPIFATVLRFTFSDDIESISTGFSLTLDQQFTIADGLKVRLDNGLAQIATVDLLTAFRTGRPDATAIYRNTHLYGLAPEAGTASGLYVADAGNNAIWSVSKQDQTPTLVTRFANTRNPNFPPGPPTSEAVPTSVRAFGNRLLVSLLSGAPFVPGTSRVMLVNAKTGEATPFITGLTSTIDVLPRRASLNSEILVLEFSTNQNANAPGQLLLYRNGTSRVLAGNLATPTSMAIDESSGSIFLTSLSAGTILKVPLP